MQMSNTTEILAVSPTPLLRWEGDRLRQVVRVRVRHEGPAAIGDILCRLGGKDASSPFALATGESVIDAEAPVIKRAEDGRGWIARMWNPEDRAVTARIAPLRGKLTNARLTNLAEEDTAETLAASADGVFVPVPARSVVTLRLNTGHCQHRTPNTDRRRSP